eukprot:scaffold313_cov91-Phaeocystis_antarctica.AAC.2
MGLTKFVAATVACNKDILSRVGSTNRYSTCMKQMENALTNNSDLVSIVSHEIDIGSGFPSGQGLGLNAPASLAQGRASSLHRPVRGVSQIPGLRRWYSNDRMGARCAPKCPSFEPRLGGSNPRLGLYFRMFTFSTAVFCYRQLASSSAVPGVPWDSHGELIVCIFSSIKTNFLSRNPNFYFIYPAIHQEIHSVRLTIRAGQ